MLLTCKEEHANNVREGRVHGLQDLLEGKFLLLVGDGASANEVGQPQGVECRKLVDVESLLEPVFPVIVVLVVVHTSHALQIGYVKITLT